MMGAPHGRGLESLPVNSADASVSFWHAGSDGIDFQTRVSRTLLPGKREGCDLFNRAKGRPTRHPGGMFNSLLSFRRLQGQGTWCGFWVKPTRAAVVLDSLSLNGALIELGER